MKQDLSKFKIPSNFRGRSIFYVQLWWMIQHTLFNHSPQFAYGFRAFILRLFGAKIGKNSIIRPTVEITYPWKVKLGDNVWIGDSVVLYSLGDITIGDNSVISQRSYICTGDHDYRYSDFPIRSNTIVIGDSCWLATDVFVAPGVTINNGCVIGARSTVIHDMPSNMLCVGSPCVPIKPRVFIG